MLSTHNISDLAGFRHFRTNRSPRRTKPYLSPLEHIYRRLYQRRGPILERQEIILPFLVPPWWLGPSTSIAADLRRATKEHNNELMNSPDSLHIILSSNGGLIGNFCLIYATKEQQHCFATGPVNSRHMSSHIQINSTCYFPGIKSMTSLFNSFG